jgi:phosphoglycolate phosphatase
VIDDDAATVSAPESRDLEVPTFVVFDLDGTLADSQEGILASFHWTLARFDRVADDDELRRYIGPPLGDSFARLGFAPGEIDQVVSCYRAHYDEHGVQLAGAYAGVPELLESLAERGVELSVATAKRVDFAERMLVNIGLRAHFDVVAGATLDGRHITKAEIVDDALDRLGRPSTRGAWMVGDRREDVAAARVHGLTPVGALWGYGTREELELEGAQWLVESPHELARRLRVAS